MSHDKEGTHKCQNLHQVLVNTTGKSRCTALAAGGIANFRLTITADQTRTNMRTKLEQTQMDEDHGTRKKTQ